ncbi:MAG: FAD-binding oxidoreductase [Pseudomonadota bacterium]
MVWRRETYSGWGRALRAEGEMARPERQSVLSGLEPAPATGGRRSYGDACLNDGGRIVNMTRLDRVLSFEDGLLHVEAGARLGEILRLFAPKGWLLPVMPGTGFATVGGAIAMDVHGKNHGAGTFGCNVTEITLTRGGEHHILTPGSPGFAATVGGLGQTGIIISARIRMATAGGRAMAVHERRMESWDEIVGELAGSTAPYAVGWIDATARGPNLGRGIIEEAEPVDAAPPPQRKSKSVPIDAPGFALSSPVVRGFNAAYYRRVPATGRRVRRSFHDFFFPLDKLRDWNRLYGKRGFHQFQCVVPHEASDKLKAMLRMIAESGLASPLAVLKRLSGESAGLMSFPMEGLTLAVDFPARDAAADLITRLEEMTLDAGGRIYLAKDALADAAAVDAMYPRRAAWAAEVAQVDPDGAYETDLTRRLKLRHLP